MWIVRENYCPEFQEGKHMKWMAKVSNVGKEVKEIAEATKQFDFVIDGKRADMNDFVVHFSGGLPVADLQVNDEVIMGNSLFYIVALGEKANQHLKTHGACTIDLSGGLVAKEDCDIVLAGMENDFSFLENGNSFVIA
jgi:sorbitol-specific phosphotransferase system component IIA